MTNYIFVKFQKEGIHKYPAAGTNPELAEVSFLQYPHRHMFHFKVYIEIYHDDRDLEFIIEKRWMEYLYQDQTLALDFKSCEMIARDLHQQLAERYKNRPRKIMIEVSEDDENGCFMTFEKE
jgi:hypothetical protein